MRAQRPGQEPKSRVFALLRRPLAAVLCAELFDFVVIFGPLLALERDRRLRAELRRARHRERRDSFNTSSYFGVGMTGLVNEQNIRKGSPDVAQTSHCAVERVLRIA